MRKDIHKIFILLTLVVMMASCGGNGEPPGQIKLNSKITPSVRGSLAQDSVGAYNKVLPEMPEPTVRMKVNHHGSYATIFNDSNYIHWRAADSLGINILSDPRSHWQLRRPLVKLTSCKDFYVDSLTHSVPYLVPEAAALVHEIGQRFNDSLRSRGGGNYRIRLTSVLRTPSGVSRLRRRNVNAVDSSVHQLATTFDISYARFAAFEPVTVARTTDDLKGLLSEILYDMRNEGKCYVKYERKQPCFHITVRPGAY